MASLSCEGESGKLKVVYFCDVGGKRQKLHLGEVSKEQGRTVKLMVEKLVFAARTRTAPPDEVASWVAPLVGPVRERLEQFGLIVPLERPGRARLADFTRGYIDGRSDLKPGSLVNLERVRSDLLLCFDRSRCLDEFTPADATAFQVFLRGKVGSEGTVRARCKKAKQFFQAAVDGRLIAENPLKKLKCGPYSNPAKFHYVTAAECKRILDACPDVQWRVIFALARYAGLRCPGEVLRFDGRMSFGIAIAWA